MEMAHFKKYRSFKCLVRVNRVSPFIVIILLGAKIRKMVILAWRAKFCPR